MLLYGNEIVGTAVFLDYEPDYDVLCDGAWLQNGNYLAVHRVACKASFRGRGVGTALLTYAAAEAVKQGAVSLRIDTHEENIPMRSLLEKNGFRLCENLKLTRSNEWRVGYEKLL